MTKFVEFENNDIDITIDEIERHKSVGLTESSLVLMFSGKDMNIKIMNSLRRICTNYIPVYAFPPETIKITENTSVAFNNDMVKCDLTQLPVVNVDPELDDLEEEYWHSVNYSDTTRPKHKKEKKIELYLNYHNNSDNYVRVTTNDAIVSVDGEQVKMYDETYPILLIELTGNQSIKLHMEAVLGIAERRLNGASWKSCRNSFYEQIEDDKYKFTVNGNDQFSEYDLLIRSCSFMIKKMRALRKIILEKLTENKSSTNETTIRLTIEKEDNTIVDPINYELQDHDNILFSGISKPDLLIKEVIITLGCKNEDKLAKTLSDCIMKVEKKFHKIGYLLTSMTGKKVSKKTDKTSKTK
jgi:DNA-directed RNA polymerase subunit L